MYNALPEHIRLKAGSQAQKFLEDLAAGVEFRKSLRFKKLQGYIDHYEATVSMNDGYRAVCVRTPDSYKWVWIGDKAAFARKFG
ncbi:MAG: hypothetical protein O3A46_13365 [Candidatus Poribacteria bacterium]|nr:hypothetical protein [Candidatus Poribacteria bacterium]